MRRRTWTWMFAALALPALGIGCGKKDPGAKPRDAGGSILLTNPDGAPLVAPVLSRPTPPVPGTGELRRCRVALRRPDWGPGTGPLEGVPLKLRTFRGRGTRAEVLKLAHESICREDGVPPEQCTDGLFVPEYEWCDGDPVPEHKPLSPEVQEMADRIRAGAESGQPVTVGAPPAADAASAEPPAEADAVPIIF
ncbi:MAG: hypothetical protein JXB32_24305 [Deltaproteobacteria bacterium]|nr:hypothetical protein [Deltaproteobacteria bacterium]